jgi:hypothetical protein
MPPGGGKKPQLGPAEAGCAPGVPACTLPGSYWPGSRVRSPDHVVGDVHEAASHRSRRHGRHEVAAPRVRADAALDSFASEKAFAAMASEKGVKTAFLTYLAEGRGRVPADATNARKAREARPESRPPLPGIPPTRRCLPPAIWDSPPGPGSFTPRRTPAEPPHPTPAEPSPDSSGTGGQRRRQQGACREQVPYGQFNPVWKKVGGGVARGAGHRRHRRGEAAAERVGSGEFEPGAAPPPHHEERPVKMSSLDEKLSKVMRKSGAGRACPARGRKRPPQYRWPASEGFEGPRRRGWTRWSDSSTKSEGCGVAYPAISATVRTAVDSEREGCRRIPASSPRLETGERHRLAGGAGGLEQARRP